ncbi:MbtH family protein [Streptomyces griseoruber]|uniref:MbtH family protein n=1 Tax=Streptomyces griseoruber TaxID=1943 RepID=UPI0006E2719F|nr:MbtH family NRPS accessory protein [Streptomyces griseoruber]
MRDEEKTSRYQVVVNTEEQYSVWPVGRDLPVGWHADGTTGTEQECMDHIDRVWADMRPLSLRLQADCQELTEYRTLSTDTKQN